MHARSLLLVCSVIAAVSAPSAAVADTSIATRWRQMQLDQENCMSYARLAIFRTGFEKADPGSQTMSGKKGNFTASIRCLADQRMIFFVVAGPDANTVSGYMTTLYGQFGVM
jgi:hypothetical protein